MDFPGVPCLDDFQSQTSYEKMFTLLRAAWQNFAPISFSVDFEMVMSNDITTIFPGCQIRFCFFHFVRNLQKKVKQQGLWQRYCADPVFALSVRMLTSVAFVPLCDVRNAVTALDMEFGNLAAFRPLIDWLLDNYVGRPRPNGTWSQPLFRPE